jgi:hypothetical protein
MLLKDIRMIWIAEKWIVPTASDFVQWWVIAVLVMCQILDCIKRSWLEVAFMHYVVLYLTGIQI